MSKKSILLIVLVQTLVLGAFLIYIKPNNSSIELFFYLFTYLVFNLIFSFIVYTTKKRK